MFRSLLAKFVLIALPVFILLNTGFLFGYAHYRLDNIRSELAAEMATLSYRLGKGLSQAVAADDSALAGSILQTLAGNRSIRCALVRDAVGNTVTGWPFPGCDAIEGSFHVVDLPLRRDGTAFGGFSIHYDETWVRDTFLKELAYIASALLFASVVAFLSCVAAHRLTIGRPLKQLTAAIERRKSEGTAETVSWRSRDELGTVVAAYNDMTVTERDRMWQLTETAQDLRLEIEERERAEHELRTAQTHLMQASKLEAMGTLASGIAHEINTPLQYLSSNLLFLKEGFQGYADAFKTVEDRKTLVPDDIAAIAEQFDLDFLKDEMPSAVEQGVHGVDQIAKIVRAIADFSHPKQSEMQAIALDALVENTVRVSANHWKDVAEVTRDIPRDLPKVHGYPGEIGQVLLNLILNAVDAIKERPDIEIGTINIAARAMNSQVEITISDTGNGIPPEHRDKVFDIFFTTKEPGKGTGQGLAICQSVIMNKHGGTLFVDSEVGVGTKVIIRLPLPEGMQSERAVDEVEPV